MHIHTRRHTHISDILHSIELILFGRYDDLMCVCKLSKSNLINAEFKNILIRKCVPQRFSDYHPSPCRTFLVTVFF